LTSVKKQYNNEAMKTKKSSIEIRGLIKRYLSQGLKPIEISRVMDMSRQAINYWVREIRNEKES
jgi:hypothetical protein